MPDPQDPNRPEEQEVPAEEQPQGQATPEQPQYQPGQQLPISDWLQQPAPEPPKPFVDLMPCSVYNCGNEVNPFTAKKDEKSGELLCDEHAFECPNCREVRSTENMRDVPDSNEQICEDCWSEDYTVCPNCDKEIPNDDYLAPNDRRNRRTMSNGGCTNCAAACNSCGKVVDKDDAFKHDGDYYCEDCYSEHFTTCESCGEVVDNDNAYYVEDDGSYCQSCYNDKFVTCHECGKTIEKDEAHEDEDGDYFCDDCFSVECPLCHETVEGKDTTEVDGEKICDACFGENFVTCSACRKPIKKGEEVIEPESGAIFCEHCFKTEKEKVAVTGFFSRIEKNFSGFSYTKKDRFLSQLIKLLPISVKDLKSQHPALANGLQDLISFAKGKTLTKDIVSTYRSTLKPEDFQVEYTRWDSTLQRSRKQVKHPQMVMNIVAGPELLAKLQSNPAMFDLFTKVNEVSKQSTHPMVPNQIGWARLEPDIDGYYILVDEIQSDHSNAAHRLKNDSGYETGRIRDALKEKYGLDDDGFKKLLNEYINTLKDFPNIANQAILGFARNNGFKKIYWHTYEGGKKLKNNAPPKSLYEETPKENFYLPSGEKPFGLDAEFMEREARRVENLTKIARKLYLKHFAAVSTLDKSSITFKP